MGLNRPEMLINNDQIYNSITTRRAFLIISLQLYIHTWKIWKFFSIPLIPKSSVIGISKNKYFVRDVEVEEFTITR